MLDILLATRDPRVSNETWRAFKRLVEHMRV